MSPHDEISVHNKRPENLLSQCPAPLHPISLAERQLSVHQEEGSDQEPNHVDWSWLSQYWDLWEATTNTDIPL